MEIADQYQGRAVPVVVSVRIPLVFRSALAVLMGVVILVCGVLITARQKTPDPFSVFRDPLNDDAKPAALVQEFPCVGAGLHRQSGAMPYTCTQRNPGPVFEGLTLWISGDIATEIVFTLGENAFTLGDLVLLWGPPDIWLYCEAVVAVWPNYHLMSLVVSPATGRISYFAPVLSVSLTRGGPSHVEQELRHDVLHHCGQVQVGSVGLSAEQG